MYDQRVLVTGANGFLGSEIVTRLLEANVPLRTTGRKDTSSHYKETEYHQADILQTEQLHPLVKDVSTVIHSAGLAHVFSPVETTTEQFRQTNENGTANLVAAAADAGVGHFILVSSVSVYGPSTYGVYDEDARCKPAGPYAISKYRAEERARQIALKSGMPLTILRMATIYGEGDRGNVARLMRALDSGRFVWIGDGGNRKSLLYKGDAARACLAVAANPSTGVRIYNVSAPPCTMREIVDGLAMALGASPLPVRIPALLAKSAGKYLSLLPDERLSRLHSTIEKWLAQDVYDTSRFENAYRFHVQVGLLEGLKREVEWHRRNQHQRM